MEAMIRIDYPWRGKGWTAACNDARL